MQIAFIGGGVMAGAIISGILGKGLVPPDAIRASDISEKRLTALREKYKINCTLSDNREASKGADVVILAVKPQTLGEVATGLNGQLQPEQLVLSIMAGVSIDTISQGLSHLPVVRIMPNIAAQIGKGVSLWTATDEVSERQREWTCSILSALGKVIYVTEEKYLDMATAISGSGPAYIFTIMGSLIKAAVNIGLPPDIAEELVLQTVSGSAQLAQVSDKNLTELRDMVTSPGGTTAEALLQLERGGLRALIAQAVSAAYHKAKLLGESTGK